MRYKRVLLKLSGESFCKPGGFGIEGDALGSIAERIFHICSLGPQVAIVVGAPFISKVKRHYLLWRKPEAEGIS